MKENVEKSIAPKEETIVEVELTILQKKYYRAIYERNFTFLKKGNKSANVPSLLNVMMELRKCCNHPYLIRGVEQNETEHLTAREQIYQTLVDASGKMVLIDKLLPKLKAGGHKVLIFSQMVRVLDILEDYLVWRGYTHERLDGRIRGNDRQAAIDRFSKPDSDRFVFLLCTRAGGLGINLTAADTVIIFDSDWNPQNDVQAQARCHRIGQEKSVKVYRLITRNTYEKHMFERASKKLGLDQAVFTKMSSSSATTPSSSTADDQSAPPASDVVLDKKTIDSLLKYGAYDLFREDDTAANRFYEEDIDRILERATVVRASTDSDTPTDNTLNFSKASFVSNSAAPEIDIHDPDFWLKLLPHAADTPNPNIQAQPRVRKQVHRFGALDGDDSDLEEDDSGALAPSSEDEELAKAYGQKEKGWTLGERARFKLALMSLGYGRWARIKAMARITRWSANEVALYGKAFLSKVIMFAEVEDPKVVELIQTAAPKEADLPGEAIDSMDIDKPLPSSVPEKDDGHTISSANNAEGTMEYGNVGESQGGVGANPSAEGKPAAESRSDSTLHRQESQEQPPVLNFDRDPSLCDARFQEYLQKNAKQIFRRLETLANLRELVHSNFSALDDIEVPDSPAPWWGAEEDRSLLLGTYRHGFGRYEEIRNDPSLCFFGHVEFRTKDDSNPSPTSPADNDSSSSSAEPRHAGDAGGPSASDPAVAGPSASTAIPLAGTPLPVSDLPQHVERAETANIANQESQSLPEAFPPSDTALKNMTESSAKQTAPSSGSVEGIVANPAAPPTVLPSTSTSRHQWPSSKILSHRVKRILRSLDMVKRQQEKDSKKVCLFVYLMMNSPKRAITLIVQSGVSRLTSLQAKLKVFQ